MADSGQWKLKISSGSQGIILDTGSVSNTFIVCFMDSKYSCICELCCLLSFAIVAKRYIPHTLASYVWPFKSV